MADDEDDWEFDDDDDDLPTAPTPASSHHPIAIHRGTLFDASQGGLFSMRFVVTCSDRA